jgi:hypothetical protein
MSPTESRTGFRLPWSTDGRAQTEDHTTPDDHEAPQDQDAPEAGAEAAATVDGAAEAAPADAEDMAGSREASDIAGDDRSWIGDASQQTAQAQTDTEVPQVIPATDAPAVPASATERAPDPAAESPRGHRPEKFLAELTRAMQTAAEAARDQSLGQFEADSKQFVDEIQTRSADEAAELRQASEEDIAATREWSKAEMARIREETEARVSQRRVQLDQELKAHAALVEQRIERVQQRLETYRTEMASFFEHLLEVEDPARFATLAEQMPEPPSLEDAWADAAAPEPTVAASVASGPAAVAPVVTTAGETVSDGSIDDAVEAATETLDEDAPVGGATQDALAGSAGWAVAEPAVDFGAAEVEAEAAASTVEAGDDGSDGSDEPVDDMSQAAVDARLAGLVLAKNESDEGKPTSVSTSIVVSGLISVASIAAFKRQVARIPGVTAVTVSSGPEGEFIFAAAHGDGAQLAGEIAAFNGFEAQVTEAGDGVLRVAARDPEA